MSVGPVDPDVDLHWEREHPSPRHTQTKVIAAIAIGGAAGASARYGFSLWAPTPAVWSSGFLHGWPLVNLAINVLGSALIGVLMVVAIDHRPDVWWLRPLLGTGVLGGFTTFSAYAVDVERLLGLGQAGAALGYLVATPVLAVAAVSLGATLTRRALAGGGRQPGAR